MKRIVNIGQFEGLIHAILSWKLTILILDAQNKYAAGVATNFYAYLASIDMGTCESNTGVDQT